MCVACYSWRFWCLYPPIERFFLYRGYKVFICVLWCTYVLPLSHFLFDFCLCYFFATQKIIFYVARCIDLLLLLDFWVKIILSRHWGCRSIRIFFQFVHHVIFLTFSSSPFGVAACVWCEVCFFSLLAIPFFTNQSLQRLPLPHGLEVSRLEF